MKFNYSYKAFTITTLLVGNLYLFLYFMKLPKTNSVPEEEYEVELALEELFPEENLATISTENIKIETHQIHNEASDFIEEIENERTNNPESLDEKLSEIDQAIEGSSNTREPILQEEKVELEKKENPDNSNTTENTLENTSKSSTNSYRLVNRKATYFPNPVYTCEGFGKVVLYIEVGANGLVNSVTFNAKSSTTSNACLVENAIKYAKKARFTKDKNKPSQMGSITYVFPGQE